MKPARLIISGTMLGLLAVVAVLYSGADWLSKFDSGPFRNQAAIGGPFSLVDHNGRPVTDEDFRGEFMLVSFGFTNCPDVCPTELAITASAFDILGEAGERVRPIFITIDPERDTPEVLGDYVARFHPRLVGLTGTPAQIKAAAEAYGAVYFQVDPEPETGPAEGMDVHAAYLMSHSTYSYLMGPDGRFLGIIAYDAGPDVMAAELKKYL
jgi:cytochrome oxidase Cu insertion factor (SCO1/SenC/PrrC family)